MAKPQLGNEEKDAVCKVIDSGMIANGAVVAEFEKRFAAYVGAKHGIATTSGTTALEVALRAFGIGPGDKVLTTPFSFIATANSIVYTGATPVFADIDPATYNMDPEKAEQVLQSTPGIRAILVVHLFGRSCEMDAFVALAKKYGVLLVEDCAQCHGATWRGQKTGSFGDAACFSFYPTKNMATGEGGMVLTDSDETEKACRMLINHGMETRYYHDIVGYNYRMTNIAAAIGLCQLDKLPRMNERRRVAAGYYDAHIRNDLVVTPQPDAGHVYHQYTMRVIGGRRDVFIEYLTAKQIGHGVFYPLTIPEQKCYAAFNFQTAYPAADLLKTQVVSLPVHPGLTDAEIREVAETVNTFSGA
ncbi:MAG: DegT/DnrJ/EryC1/StrS family aminotransferase [Clostridiales bacterium]|nr:DegT/DnrJ/EryC1/StrS family aminotransferase [Clostridiales bacterium]